MIYSRKGNKITLVADTLTDVLDWSKRFTDCCLEKCNKVTDGYKTELIRNENSTRSEPSLSSNDGDQ